jgi:hypothetical protein
MFYFFEMNDWSTLIDLMEVDRAEPAVAGCWLLSVLPAVLLLVP